MNSVAIILWLLHKIVYTFSSNTIQNVYTICMRGSMESRRCLTHPRKITPYYKKHCKVTENRPWIHITTPYPRTLHPGKILDLGLVFVSIFKKKDRFIILYANLKKKNHFLYKLNHTNKWFSDVQMYKQILNFFIRTNKGLWVNQRLISPPNINALCLGQSKRVPYCVYEGKLNV